MVLECYGHVVSEFELRQRCACDDDGTYPSKIVEVAKQYGLKKSGLVYLELDQLQENLSLGLHPIVWLELSFRSFHSVVVVEITKEQVHVLDPEIGERAFDIRDFNLSWSAYNGLTILIEE